MKVWNYWCKLRDRLREGVAGVSRRKSERQTKRERERGVRACAHARARLCVCASMRARV